MDVFGILLAFVMAFIFGTIYFLVNASGETEDVYKISLGISFLVGLALTLFGFFVFLLWPDSLLGFASTIGIAMMMAAPLLILLNAAMSGEF
jgi:hypothetical protein